MGAVTHLVALYYEWDNFCPQMYLIWWSATGLSTSIFLIELDRFLAIRFPFKYPLLITKERSLGTCAVTQIGCLAITLAVRIISPNYLLFLFIIVIPYFVCFLLSFLCALYVVKAMLTQKRREKRVTFQLISVSCT